MDSPLLSPRTETCETSETCPTMFPVPPPLDPIEIRIVPVNKSFTPSDQQQENPSIYKTGTLNRKFYRPQVVSFGPYHHGKDELKPMEKHKDHALQHFLDWSRKPKASFLEYLREVEPDLKGSYQALDQKRKKGTDQFLDLMIRDGCFMLEIMRTTVGEKRGYESKDHPIFNSYRQKYITPIQRDMLLLENQLPIRVLYRLVAVENNGEERDQYEYINGLILEFYSLNKCGRRMDTRRLHVVDVFRKGLLMEVQHEQENKEPLAVEEIIQSATELEGWIRFEKSKTDSLNDISFCFSKGVLRLPRIEVNETTQSMFLNLMTFERLHAGAGNEITSYVTFMDNIINNKRDVELLLAQDIIKNARGSNTEVAKLFNSLGTEVPLPSNGKLNAVQKKICEYREQPWNKVRATLKRWWANLNRTYFRSPWSIISVIAAIFLFALTIIQTVYAVLSYN